MMSTAVNVHDAKTHFSRLLDRAHAGEEIVLAKAGKPYARLMPLEAPVPQRRPGRLKGKVDAVFFDPLPEGDLVLWEGSEGRV
jgi:prevent-host-death family protein